MMQTRGIINTLKSELKLRSITYAMLAKHLDMSEANIKKMFSTERFSLDRIETICDLMGLDILELIKSFEKSRHRITYLNHEQEMMLVADTKLLLVAVCVQNGYSFSDIVHSFDVSETECIQHMAKLDRLKLIELLPNNLFRILFNEDFHWLPDGPIEKFFETKVQPDFLQSSFTKKNESRIFRPVLLSSASQNILQEKIEELYRDVDELYQKDSLLPLDQRHHTALLIATRPWVFSDFKYLTK